MTPHAEAQRAPDTTARPPTFDRRHQPRVVPEHPPICDLAQADGTSVPARALNLSASGLAALTTRAVPVGSRVRMVLTNAAATFSLERTLTVLRCDRLPGGRWSVAGPFDEMLSTEELRPFLV
jgi:hypothetical protein